MKDYILNAALRDSLMNFLYNAKTESLGQTENVRKLLTDLQALLLADGEEEVKEEVKEDAK